MLLLEWKSYIGSQIFLVNDLHYEKNGQANVQGRESSKIERGKINWGRDITP